MSDDPTVRDLLPGQGEESRARLAKSVRRMRRERRLSLEELARSTDMSVRTVQRAEHGDASLSTYRTLVAYLQNAELAPADEVRSAVPSRLSLAQVDAVLRLRPEQRKTLEALVPLLVIP